MNMRRDVLLFAAILLFGALPMIGEPYTLRLGTFACMYAVMAVSWHVIGGLAGYPSFATAAFFGLGAYAGGIMLAQGYPLAMAAATAGALAFAGAMLLGAVLLRLRGHYFAIASLAVAEVLRELTNTTTELTGGGMGLNIPLDTSFEPGMAGIAAEASFFFTAMWALLLVTLIVVIWVERSKLGFGLACIRQNESAADMIGRGRRLCFSRHRRVGLAQLPASAFRHARAAGRGVALVPALWPDLHRTPIHQHPHPTRGGRSTWLA